jgi:DNA-binding IclR family transcriptional regulator
VVRALRILRAFSDARAEWSLAELSRELGLSKPTAFRLLGALEEAELLARTEPAGGFRLGPGAIELGARAQRANPILSAARPELEALTRETGETSSVEILAGATTFILDEVQGGHVIGSSPGMGTRWPAHATSTGKVLLAAAQEEEPGLARRLAARERLDQVIVDDLHDHLRRGHRAQHLLADRLLPDLADELLDDRERDVGLEERDADLAQRRLDVALAEGAVTAQAVEDVAESAGQALEHHHSKHDRAGARHSRTGRPLPRRGDGPASEEARGT